MKIIARTLFFYTAVAFTAPSIALAGGSCEITTLSGGYIMVGDAEYKVGDALGALKKCGRKDLAIIADRWGRHRRVAIGTGIGGIFIFPLWIVTGIAAYNASEDRSQFSAEL